MEKISRLSSNALKLAALVAMTVDHIGMILFPEVLILRIVGRTAFPIFAYMIGEGCTHTENRLKYFLRLLAFGIPIQLFYFIFEKNLFFNIFITFSVSILLCTSYDRLAKSRTVKFRPVGVALFLLTVAAAVFLTFGLREFLEVPISFDGGAFGILVPLAVYIPKKKPLKLLSCAAVCCIVSLDVGTVQWFSLSALPLLALYSGKRGKYNLKYFFYFYYPLHIAVIYGIFYVLKR